MEIINIIFQSNMVVTTYVDGFLTVGQQVVEPIKVSFPLSKGQLQLVYLIVLLLNGSKLLIQGFL